MTDYYKVLNVPKSATDAEIKTAYKKQALKHHPDRNKGSEESSKKFKEVSEAFEVLSDSNKRAVFDQFGEEGLKGGGSANGASAGPGGAQGFPGGFGGFPGGGAGGPSFSFSTGGAPRGGASGFTPTNAEDIFRMFMGGGMGGMGGGGHNPFAQDDDDNDMMSGFGGMPGGHSHRRASSHPHQSAPDPPQEVTRPLKVSLEDLYTGVTKRLKVSRRRLDGTNEDKVLEIQVHPGWKSGTKVRFPRAGNEDPSSGQAQDLVFVVEEKAHETFTREGNNLVVKKYIPLVDALTGGGPRSVIVSLLDGRKKEAKLPEGIIKPGQLTRIPNEGMPIRKDGKASTKGDLVVQWEITFPDRITPAQKEGIRKILS